MNSVLADINYSIQNIPNKVVELLLARKLIQSSNKSLASSETSSDSIMLDDSTQSRCSSISTFTSDIEVLDMIKPIASELEHLTKGLRISNAQTLPDCCQETCKRYDSALFAHWQQCFERYEQVKVAANNPTNSYIENCHQKHYYETISSPIEPILNKVDYPKILPYNPKLDLNLWLK